jgi:hypothetical protein
LRSMEDTVVIDAVAAYHGFPLVAGVLVP